MKNSVYEQWQQDAYSDILSAYESQLQAFNDAQTIDQATEEGTSETKDSGQITGNPLFNAEVVKTEIKRLCIELMMKPFGLNQGKDFYQNGECDVPYIDSCNGLADYATMVKFFEQAFEWDLMYQKFFPYYWAKRCDWKSLLQSQDGNDYIFQAFLQSGMARVIVPVRQGFEDAVAYYMATGEIWNGVGLVADVEDSLYLNLADDMTDPEGNADGLVWETTVPSTLTVIQARSVLLDEEGLPCCDTDGILGDLNTIDPDTNILKLKADTNP